MLTEKWSFLLFSAGLLTLVTWSQPAEAKKKKSTPPCWIVQPCTPYTTDSYMIGVGSGSSLEEADAAAMAAIAKQFSIHISQAQTASKEFSETMRDGKDLSETAYQNLRSKTKVETQSQLEHVVIAEHWLGKRSKESPDVHYSLAVIERNTWLASIDQQRMQLSTDISALRMKIRQSTSISETFQHYRALLPLIERDLAYYNQRQIIDLAQGSMPPAMTLQQLEAEVHNLQQNAQIWLPMDTPYRDIVLQGLADFQGNVRAPSVGDADLRIQCLSKVDENPPEGSPFYKVNILLSCQLFEQTVQIHQFEFKGSASSQDVNKAHRQSKDALLLGMSDLPKYLHSIWSVEGE